MDAVASIFLFGPAIHCALVFTLELTSTNVHRGDWYKPVEEATPDER